MIHFIFDTLPNFFFVILSTLQDFVDFVFAEITFDIGSQTFTYSPIEIFFGAGIHILGIFIFFRFIGLL